MTLRTLYIKAAAVDAARVARGASVVLRATVQEYARPSTLYGALASAVSLARARPSRVATADHDSTPSDPSPPSSSSPSPSGDSSPSTASPSTSDPSPSSPTTASPHPSPTHKIISASTIPIEHAHDPATAPTSPTPLTPSATTHIPTPPTVTTMRERAVPESAISRVFAFGGLGAGLVVGAAAEATRRVFGQSETDQKSTFITEANAERLAATLSRMRGAALKLGQMLSIQDEAVIPPVVSRALERVRQAADIMPPRQLHATLAEQLGADWRERVVRFDDVPIAAASIGQVHRGAIVIGGEGEKEGEEVEVVFKVQYPGVAGSIRSDIANLRRMMRVGNFIPDNFFLDQALDVAEEELKRECDYDIELANQQQYRDLVLSDDRLHNRFYVPRVFPEWSARGVLVSEYVKGVPIDRMASGDTQLRNQLGEDMLRLTMTELFVLAFQQSDPNWSNYLYDAEKDVINLIDFGAARPYDEAFLMNYLKLIRACAARDRDAVIEQSIKLGFLNGEESTEMLEAHAQASFAVGEPFHQEHIESGYDFTKNDIPKRTAKFGKVMLDYRLKPPPKEAYSLHRRLSGAFLMSTKLGARVNATKMLEETVQILKKRGKLVE